jgi:hypothetical protein
MTRRLCIDMSDVPLSIVARKDTRLSVDDDNRTDQVSMRDKCELCVSRLLTEVNVNSSSASSLIVVPVCSLLARNALGIDRQRCEILIAARSVVIQRVLNSTGQRMSTDGNRLVTLNDALPEVIVSMMLIDRSIGLFVGRRRTPEKMTTSPYMFIEQFDN